MVADLRSRRARPDGWRPRSMAGAVSLFVIGAALAVLSALGGALIALQLSARSARRARSGRRSQAARGDRRAAQGGRQDKADRADRVARDPWPGPAFAHSVRCGGHDAGVGFFADRLGCPTPRRQCVEPVSAAAALPPARAPAQKPAATPARRQRPCRRWHRRPRQSHPSLNRSRSRGAVKDRPRAPRLR